MNACKQCFVSLYSFSGWGGVLAAELRCHFWTVGPHYNLIIPTPHNQLPPHRFIVNHFFSYSSFVFELTAFM